MARLPLTTYEQHLRAAKLLYVIDEALQELRHLSRTLGARFGHAVCRADGLIDHTVRRIAFQDFKKRLRTDLVHPYLGEFREETRWLFGSPRKEAWQSVPGGPVTSALTGTSAPEAKALDSVRLNERNRTP